MLGVLVSYDISLMHFLLGLSGAADAFYSYRHTVLVGNVGKSVCLRVLLQVLVLRLRVTLVSDHLLIVVLCLS